MEKEDDKGREREQEGKEEVEQEREREQQETILVKVFHWGRSVLSLLLYLACMGIIFYAIATEKTTFFPQVSPIICFLPFYAPCSSL